jgi:hypothetical protein
MAGLHLAHEGHAKGCGQRETFAISHGPECGQFVGAKPDSHLGLSVTNVGAPAGFSAG